MEYTPIEIDAVWAYIRALQASHGITEAAATDATLDHLTAAGRPLKRAALKKHRDHTPRPETDTDDIGREMLERGLEWEAPTEDDDAATWADQHIKRLQAYPDAFAAVRENVGIIVIAALFRRILPGLPDRKWESKPKSRSIKPGLTITPLRPLCKAGHVEAHDPISSDLLIGRTTDGMLITDMLGQVHALRKGCIAIYDSKGSLVDVMIECTLRRTRTRPSGSREIEYLEWSRSGIGDWAYSFRKFVTYASIYSPGETNALTGAGIASLLGETRAALSWRKQQEVAAYRQETGGRSGFHGMRTTADPRKGKRKPNQAVANTLNCDTMDAGDTDSNQCRPLTQTIQLL